MTVATKDRVWCRKCGNIWTQDEYELAIFNDCLGKDHFVAMLEDGECPSCGNTGDVVPLTEEEVCPLCDGVLEHAVGEHEDIVYDGIRCPNGCSLGEVWG